MNTASTSTPAPAAVRLLQTLLRWLTPQPQPLQALPQLLLQVSRARSLRQLLEVQHLAACWLAGQPQQLQHLHQQSLARLQHLALTPPFPRSTSSSGKTARRTGKRRR